MNGVIRVLVRENLRECGNGCKKRVKTVAEIGMMSL